jgi:hypothetical protein
MLILLFNILFESLLYHFKMKNQDRFLCFRFFLYYSHCERLKGVKQSNGLNKDCFVGH